MASDPPTPEATEAARIMDQLRAQMSYYLRGLIRCGAYRVLAVVGSLGTVFHDLSIQYIKQEAETGGRVGYEHAKSAVTNLNTMLVEDLARFCQEYEQQLLQVETSTDTGVRH